MKILLFFLLFSSLQAALPRDFCYKAKNENNKVVFTLESNKGVTCGTVRMENRSENGAHLCHQGADGAVLSRTAVELSSSYDLVSIYNQGQRLIGTIRHETFSLAPSQYVILDARGCPLAYAKGNLLGTLFSLYETNGEERLIATFYRPPMHILGDPWWVTLEQPTPIDERLIVILGAFQATLDLSPHFLQT